MAAILGAGESCSYFLGCLAEPRYCRPLQGPWLEQAPMSVPTVCSPTIHLLRLLMARLPLRVAWRCPLLSFTWFLPSSLLRCWGARYCGDSDSGQSLQSACDVPGTVPHT